MRERGIRIDYEVADKITLANLKDHRAHLEKELNDYFTKGEWMHSDDVDLNNEMIRVITRVIKYFGEE